ncbi:MAG TPA: hypothetical protein VGX37_03125 [Allosphingosinicella sp.]|jgi:hypothetical protein|nr:hypothetical protein [Allosphingosinicella sp.]
MRTAFLACSALLALPALALAQQPGVPAPEAAAAAAGQQGDVAGPADDPRVNQLIIYGDDPCPQSTNDEIIVCARLPEGDRYRIPPNLRDNPDQAGNQSWANRATELSYVGASGIGSCSTAGAGGSIGCFNQIVQQARAERARGTGVDWSRLVQEAREARMRRIGEVEVQEEEADRDAPQ